MFDANVALSGRRSAALGEEDCRPYINVTSAVVDIIARMEEFADMPDRMKVADLSRQTLDRIRASRSPEDDGDVLVDRLRTLIERHAAFEPFATSCAERIGRSHYEAPVGAGDIDGFGLREILTRFKERAREMDTK
jgi:hypothetical protein